MAKWRKLELINANLPESTSEASPSQILENVNRVAGLRGLHISDSNSPNGKQILDKSAVSNLCRHALQ